MAIPSINNVYEKIFFQHPWISKWVEGGNARIKVNDDSTNKFQTHKAMR